MKPKTSPTSPKANKKQQSELDKFYQQSLKTIEKPPRSGMAGRLGFLVIVIIFGFLSGALSLIILLSYGSEIPWLENLDLFSNSSQSSFFITSNGSGKILTSEQVNKIVEEINPAIVQIFQDKDSPSSLESLYLPGDSLGNGFILTEDGYIVTTKQSILNLEDNYVVITYDGDIFEVDNIIEDPVTNFIFLKIESTNLQTITLDETEELNYVEDILVMKRYALDSRPIVQKYPLLDSSYREINNVNDMINSTESYPTVIWLGDKAPTTFSQAIAFTFDKKAIGIIEAGENGYSIVPFSQISPILDGLLSNQTISRPYLGLRYINLFETVNMPDNLSAGLQKGALIYSDDETQRPSIEENSPAQKAGLKTEDIIISINGQALNGQISLSDLILSYQPGQVIDLDIQRAEETMEIKITLEELK